jgi:hypothetical protein
VNRTVSDLQTGEEVPLSIAARFVNDQGELYLSPSVPLDDSDYLGKETFRLQHDQEGKFHVFFDGQKHEFKPERIEPYTKDGLLIPIDSITL